MALSTRERYLAVVVSAVIVVLGCTSPPASGPSAGRGFAILSTESGLVLTDGAVTRPLKPLASTKIAP